MVDMQPVLSYAACALMSLAIHQAQIDHCVLPENLNGYVAEDENALISTESANEDEKLWVSPQSGLLRPIFRFLKIESKAWIGLEQTALSTGAKSYVGDFLRILSDDQNASTSNDAESDLAENIETIALKLDDSFSCSNETDANKASEILGQTSSVQNSVGASSSSIDNPRKNLHEMDISSGTTKTIPYLKEDYFSCIQPKKHEETDSCVVKNQEVDTGTGKLRGVPVSMHDYHHHFGNVFPKDDFASELQQLTNQRKLVVLYELLSAAVADIPEGDDVTRSRRGYDARQRLALRLLATWLDVKWTKVAAMEILVAYATLAAQKDKDEKKDKGTSEIKSWAKWKRSGLIGAAAVTGGALLAITGGLAAPAIAAGLSALAPTLGTIIPAIGSTGFSAAAAAAGSVAGSVAVAASFGAAGAGLTGYKMARRTGGIEEFGFEGLGENHQQGRLAVGIVVSGFLNDPNDFTRPWQGCGYDLEMYAIRWETKNLMALSTAIHDWLTSSISKELMKQGAMLTVLSTLLSALAWPSTLLSLTDLIDSKWVVAVDRSGKAGKLLADVLTTGLQGDRPVTLIGFSLGARVIFKCLEKLAKRGEQGRIVERVILLGAPLSIEAHRWKAARKVVAGRFINVYSTNDWLLAIVYRASLLSQGLAGIQPVNIPGIENVDVTNKISGHSSYLSNILEILEVLNIDDYFPRNYVSNDKV